MASRRTRQIVRFGLIIAIATTGVALSQKERPLYLDTRPGEDSLLIDVTEITQQYPRQAVQQYQKAVSDAGKGRLLSAVEHLEEAIRIAPAFFSAHNSLGILYQRMTRYRDAEQEYNEAHRLNPRSAAPLVNLGNLHIEESSSNDARDSHVRVRMLNEALASLNAALEIQPSSAQGQYLKGVVYYVMGFYEDAEFHFQRALDSGVAKGIGRLAHANVYIKMQDWNSAISQLDAYLVENRFASNRAWVEEAREDAAQKLGGRLR